MFKIVLALDYLGGGWQETYFLPSSITNHSDALPFGRILGWGRTLFIGSNVSVQLSRAINDDSDKDALVCPLPYPLGPHPSWLAAGTGQDNLGDPEDRFTAVMCKCETMDGKWANRYFRGCPDHYISKETLNFPQVFTPNILGSAFLDPDPSVSPGAMHTPLCQSFWRWFIGNVKIRHHDRLSDTYSPIDFAYFTYTKITRRATGTGFARSRGRRARNNLS